MPFRASKWKAELDLFVVFLKLLDAVGEHNGSRALEQWVTLWVALARLRLRASPVEAPENSKIAVRGETFTTALMHEKSSLVAKKKTSTKESLNFFFTFFSWHDFGFPRASLFSELAWLPAHWCDSRARVQWNLFEVINLVLMTRHHLQTADSVWLFSGSVEAKLLAGIGRLWWCFCSVFRSSALLWVFKYFLGMWWSIGLRKNF